MSNLIDTCPACGERALIAVCRDTVEFAVANGGEGTQDWSMREVFYEDEETLGFRCDNCDAQYTEFTLDPEDGYLIGLGPSPATAPESPPEET